MESLLFLIDAVVMILVVFWGLIDDRRPKGAAQTSLFRFNAQPEAVNSAKKPAGPQMRARR